MATQTPDQVFGSIDQSIRGTSFAAEVPHGRLFPLTNGGVFQLGGRIIDAVKNIISGGMLTDEFKKIIKAAALKYFDDFNILAVPDAIEATLKSFFRPALVTLLDSLLATA